MLLIVVLILLKIVYTLNLTYLGWDGSYYYNIAQNIRDAKGFVTNISLYHQGMPYLPHPSPVYPLWPLLLGYLAKLFPIDVLAVGLPCLFYVLSLLIIYSLVQKLLPESAFSIGRLKVSYANIAVGIWGLHTSYFEATSRPYTEGLAFLLFFLFLWRLYYLVSKPSFYRYLEVGLWVGILFLCRSQFVTLILAILSFQALLIFFAKKTKPIMLPVGFIAGFLIVYTPQLFYLHQEIGQINLGTILLFDQYQATHILSPLDVHHHYENIPEFIWAKLYGFIIAFSPWEGGEHSYRQSFHGLEYSFIIFMAVLIRILKKEMSIHPVKSYGLSLWKKLTFYLAEPKYHFLIILILFSLISFASIHMIHKKIWAVWNFPTRHAVLNSLLFFGCFIFIFKSQSKTLLYTLTKYLVLLGILFGFTHLATKTKYFVLYGNPLSQTKQKLIVWIDEEKQASREGLTIAMYNPQMLVPYTRDVNFHWIYEGTSKEDLENLFQKLKTKYILLTKDQYKAFQEKINRFDDMFPLLQEDISGYSVFKYKHQNNKEIKNVE